MRQLHIQYILIIVSYLSWLICCIIKGLKSHAVTMFEVGKLSDESLDSFLSELEKVSELKIFSQALMINMHFITNLKVKNCFCSDLLVRLNVCSSAFIIIFGNLSVSLEQTIHRKSRNISCGIDAHKSIYQGKIIKKTFIQSQF